MIRAVVLLASLALCHSHAVLPLVAPAHHGAVVAAIPVNGYAGHGYGGYGYGGYGHSLGYGAHGYGHSLGYGAHGYGNGLIGYGAHHLLKRSPHIVSPLTHVAPVAQVAPVAVSHQARLDYQSSPAVLSTSVIPAVAPVHYSAPLLHKSLVAAPLHYGGLYGAGFHGAHYGHGLY